MIIDAHLHLSSPAWFDPSDPVFPRVQKENRRRKLSHPRSNISRLPPDQAHIDYARQIFRVQSLGEQAELLLADMDAAGIDKAILMAMDYDMTGQKVRVPHWEQLVELAELRDKHPDRFLIFCGMDLRRGRDGLPLFERAVKELGCLGLKLLPHWGFYPNDHDLCYPYYEKCVEWNIPVTSNCSAIGSSHVAAKYCHPLLWEDVARDFPEMNICLAHGGVPYHYEYALALAQLKHNIYMDLGDWQSRDPLSIEIYLRLVRRAMNSPAKYKVIFASDWPVFRAIYDEKEWVELLTRDARQYGFEFTEEELDLIFYQNVQDYLDLDL